MSRESASTSHARLAEARALANQGRFAAARRRALSTLAHSAEPHPDERAAVAATLAEIAQRAVAANAIDEAEQCLRAALRQRADFADLRHRLAGLLESQQRFEEARVELVEALRINPGYVAARVSLALLDARMGQLGEAMDALRRLEQNRRPAEADSFDRGLRSMQAADWEEAESLLRRAYGLSEGSLDDAIARFMRQAQGGNLAEARAIARELVGVHPDYPDVHYLLGRVELELGNAAEAMGSLAQALELNPDFHMARLELARALDALGQPAMAQDMVNAVLQRDPQNPAALGLSARWARRPRGEAVQMPLDPGGDGGQS